HSGMRCRLIGGYFDGMPSPGQPALKHLADTFSARDPHPPISSSERDDLSRQLRTNRVGAVVVAPVPHEEEAVEFFTSVLGRPAWERSGFHVWLLDEALSAAVARPRPDGASSFGVDP